MNTLQRKVALRLVLVLGLMGSAIAQTGGGFEHVIISPADLKWVDMPTGQGQRRAVLFGDPAKASPYTIRMRFPPNSIIPPHSHPDDRQVTVVSGTLYLGQGGRPDREKAIKAQPGTFFTEPRRVVHYGFTGPEEVITQVSGIGPTSTDYLK
ncbi:MAG TPA: cupin domain-containing protein [Blastocatellia bacterium]|nr:cupin domain-containing protein [Blastocatellia bacterium]